MKTLSILSALLFLLSACVTTHSYEPKKGEVPASIKGGVIVQSGKMAKDKKGTAIGTVRIAQINDVPTGSATQTGYLIAPAKTKITYDLDVQGGSVRNSFSFHAKPGQSYELSGKGDAKRGTVYVKNKAGTAVQMISYESK